MGAQAVDHCGHRLQEAGARARESVQPDSDSLYRWFGVQDFRDQALRFRVAESLAASESGAVSSCHNTRSARETAATEQRWLPC